uniref:Uncharacterized protein n=1 Tax=Arundo donax TaxID=35708 RepID=A0A0A9B0V9_ARUDO
MSAADNLIIPGRRRLDTETAGEE